MFEFKGWYVNLDKNLLCGPEGVTYLLTPKLAEIMFIFIRKKGAAVPYEEFIRYVWPRQEPEGVQAVLTTQIAKLRRTLPSKFKFRNARTRSYWLEIDD